MNRMYTLIYYFPRPWRNDDDIFEEMYDLDIGELGRAFWDMPYGSIFQVLKDGVEFDSGIKY